jgi:hypothetical protein
MLIILKTCAPPFVGPLPVVYRKAEFKMPTVNNYEYRLRSNVILMNGHKIYRIGTMHL